MRIHNVHCRLLNGTPDDAAPLLAELATADDRLWPWDRWPPMRFAGGLRVGARGGHGPVRYQVSAVEPHRVWFEFNGEQLTSGFRGGHGFEIRPREGVTELVHVLTADVGWSAWLRWIVAVRWLHDALIEDALDRAQLALGKPVERPARWSAWVRVLRWLLEPRKKTPRNAQGRGAVDAPRS